MKRRQMLVAACCAGALAAGGAFATAAAQEKIKVGVVGHFSGPFAASGKQYRAGFDAFRAIHGNKVGNREIELIFRDVGGTNPATAKRLAEELTVRDKVQILTGFYLTPDAFAAAPVINETKTPTVVLTAASPPILRQSPYFIRVASSIWQTSTVPADWGLKLGKKTAYIAVSDYAPGHDAQAAFKHRYTELGGKIVGEDRMPLNTVDYAPFIERIANAKPDMVHVNMPNGAPATAFLRALGARGLIKQGMVFVGVGEADDPDLPALGETALGYHSSLYYAASLDNPENKKFVAEIAKVLGPNEPANFAMAAAYDGMQIIYRMVEAQKAGAFDADAAIAAAKGYQWKSPRGPVMIDPDTRNIVQNVYIRKVESKDGKLFNAVVDTFPAVKDPWEILNKK